jgi:hypothetical protein
MLEHDAEAFCQFSSLIGQAIVGFQFGRMPDERVIAQSLMGLQSEARRIGLTSVDSQIERMKQSHISGTATQKSCLRMYHELYNRLQDELKSRIFLAVSEDMAKYYRHDEPLFGKRGWR